LDTRGSRRRRRDKPEASCRRRSANADRHRECLSVRTALGSDDTGCPVPISGAWSGRRRRRNPGSGHTSGDRPAGSPALSSGMP
jgi:hypothetical protein